MLKKVLFFLLILPLSLISQNLEKINLYLDCSYLCDKDFLKREMPFVNFMRDPSDSHVQVIVKSENSASGRKRLSFRFIGLNEFQGKEDYYFTSIAPDISKEEKRVEILDLLKKGLFPYILKSEEASNFVLSYELKNDISTRDTIDDFDIWRNWVFRLNFSGWANIEKGYTNQNYNSRITINKITENSKFLSSFRLNNSKTNYDYPDYQFETKTKSTSANFTYVKSVSPKFSAGALTNISRNTYSNYNLKLRFTTSMEYNFYPYSESSEHRLSVMYGVGFGYNDYIDSTIYFKTKENFLLHECQIQFDNIQKWGSIGLNMYGYQILNSEDLGKYYLNIGVDLNWKVVKGLSLNCWSWATLNRAQISLVKGDVSSEDILTRQRELESNYNFYVNFGVSYTFGSTKNNIVNPRF